MNNLVKIDQPIFFTSIRIEDLISTFVTSQDVKPSSRLVYKRTLRQYFAWIERKKYLLEKIQRTQLLEYKDELLASNLSSLTVGSYINSVRRFYEWTEANKYYPNVAKGIRTPKRKQQFRKQPLLPSQATALLSYFQERDLRDYALVNLLIRTGLRTVEILRADIGDITFISSKRVLKVHGKGRDEKDNFVVLTDKTYAPIKAYLLTRHTLNDSEPLFISVSNNSKGERLSTRSISYVVKQGLKAIGLDEKNFTAHSLRHTTAVNILRAGGSLEQVQMTLRHSNPATTQIYTSALDEERRLQNSGEALLDYLY